MKKTEQPIFPVLEREMEARGVTVSMIFRSLGITLPTLWNKRTGVTEFRLCEAVDLHRRFFPDVDFLTLFQRDDRPVA